MKSGAIKLGFTLIEMIITVAVIVILVSMVVGITKRIDDQNRERLCRNELALIDNALEQFRDFGYDYKNLVYAPFNFPLDFSGFTAIDIQTKLGPAFGVTTVISPATEPPHDPCYSGSEVLYFCLNQIPDCRTTLDKIDKSLVTSDINGVSLNIVINPGATQQILPFRRFIDPWKMTLRYDYYDEFEINPVVRANGKKTFPVIISAGSDRKFGTNDDIVNRQGK
jgi:prepilin-type N-terminal cleavage/methylation domain-containing protein